MDPPIIHSCGQFGESKRLAHHLYTSAMWSTTGLCFINALYVLRADLLATHIRAHPNIKGLQPIISQYADDTTILLPDDDSITYVFQIFQTYEEGCWC